MLEAKNNNLIIEEIIPDNKTASGIIITSDEKKSYRRGRVLTQGSLFFEQVVLFMNYDSIEVSDNGSNYLIVPSDKILSIIV